jgi:uncharacterized protein (UPF0262 family)
MSGNVFRPDDRLVELLLDETIARAAADVEHERKVAIFDLLESNAFRPLSDVQNGPYRLKLSNPAGKLTFEIQRVNGEHVTAHILSLTPFRRIVSDYHDICESYYNAIRNLTPGQIEAIDMGRRGVHNDGSQILVDRLTGKIAIDFDTARRLFTLLCALYRGE